MYDLDPTNPDCEELAKVTDYVVAYACKGNDSLQGEKEKFKSYILSLNNETLNHGDVNPEAGESFCESARGGLLSRVFRTPTSVYVCF